MNRKELPSRGIMKQMKKTLYDKNILLY